MLYFTIILGLVFAYVNGMHDGGNVVATAITSRVFSPRKAVIAAGAANFLGSVFLGTHVAETIFRDIISVDIINENTQKICLYFVIASFSGSLVWNVVTWIIHLPSSASHSMIGAMIGAGLAAYGSDCVQWSPIFFKVILAMIISPAAGFIAGLLLDRIFIKLLHNGTVIWNRRITIMHKVSNLLLALSYGSNDSQKVMGLIAIAVLHGSCNSFSIPLWLPAAVGASLSVGTITGGYRMIKTVGMDICKINLKNSFTSQTATIFVMAAANITGLPVSATQVITSSVMGVGSSDTPKSVNWPIAKKILAAWIITIPISAFAGYLVFAGLVRF